VVAALRADDNVYDLSFLLIGRAGAQGVDGIICAWMSTADSSSEDRARGMWQDGIASPHTTALAALLQRRRGFLTEFARAHCRVEASLPPNTFSSEPPSKWLIACGTSWHPWAPAFGAPSRIIGNRGTQSLFPVVVRRTYRYEVVLLGQAQGCRQTSSGYVFETERGTPFTTDAANRLIKRIGERAGFPSRFTSTCCGTPAVTRWPMQGMTHGQLDIARSNTPPGTRN
jgi:hypothetical protein